MLAGRSCRIQATRPRPEQLECKSVSACVFCRAMPSSISLSQRGNARHRRFAVPESAEQCLTNIPRMLERKTTRGTQLSRGVRRVDGVMNSDDLGRRHHALLLAVIQDFVATAEPVGSQHIVAKYSLGVRAATVRSMMAELESENFLHQPHTSAGRIPTPKAFRYY